MSAYLAVVGECLVDVVHSETSPPKAHVGGSPFNVAVGLARLENNVVFAGRRGDDEYGRMIARSLRAQGITSLLEADGQPTSVAKATLDPTGQATYEFTLDWSLPPAERLASLFHEVTAEPAVGPAVGPSDAAPSRPGLSEAVAAGPEAQIGEALQNLDLLHTGSIAAMLQPGADTVKTLLEGARKTATISYDPNYRPTIVPNREVARAQAEEFIALSDVIQASTDDIDLLYPERSHRETMNAWLELGPALITVTRGASGAMAVAQSGFVEQDAFPIDVADTVGAGDSFMAATLATLRSMGLLGAQSREDLQEISHERVAEVLRTAACAAAITSSRFGAQPPTPEELASALNDGVFP